MFGSVGGTLGMCIGFSFTGVISSLINLLQYAIMIIKKKLSKKKLSYSNSKNDSIHVKGDRDFNNYDDSKHECQKGLEELKKELKKVVKENSMKFKNIERKIDKLI